MTTQEPIRSNLRSSQVQLTISRCLKAFWSNTGNSNLKLASNLLMSYIVTFIQLKVRSLLRTQKSALLGHYLISNSGLSDTSKAVKIPIMNVDKTWARGNLNPKQLSYFKYT